MGGSLSIESASSNKIEDHVQNRDSNNESSNSQENSDQLKIGSIYFGSQTGTSESFAKDLSVEISESLMDCNAFDLEDFEQEKFVSEKFVCLIVSTYGEGDATDNAVLFDKWLTEECDKPETSPDRICLPNMKYCVCGLGNSTYRQYNSVGKRVDQNLARLGATRILPLNLCDDAADIESDFLSWKDDQLIPFLSRQQAVKKRDKKWKKPGESLGLQIVHQRRKIDLPFDARIVSGGSDVVGKFYFSSVSVPVSNGRVLQEEGFSENSKSIKKNVEISLEISKIPSLRYKTGDSVELLPENSSTQVLEICSILKCFDILDEWITFTSLPVASACLGANAPPSLVRRKKLFPTPTTLRRALTLYCDLNGYPSMSFIKQFSHWQAFAKLKVSHDEELEKEGERIFQEISMFLSERKRRRTFLTMIEFLKEVSVFFQFPSIDIETFLLICPRQKPRYYTICSSNLKERNRVDIVIGLEQEKTSEGIVSWRGAASNYICNDLVHSDFHSPKLPIFHHLLIKATNFRLPANTNLPIIMICAGTGFAPFRGFLRDMEIRTRKSEKFLFFGCPSYDSWIYRDEIISLKIEDLKICMSFSRLEKKNDLPNPPPSSSIHFNIGYVQDNIRNFQQDLKRVLTESGGVVFVCGSGEMCRGVEDAINKFVFSTENLKKSKKYVEESWG